jgi:glutamate--cysteine ligase
MTEESIEAQKGIEANDTMPFEIYREQYVSPARLGFRTRWVEAAGPVSQRAEL